jgi:hypothetical protein
MAFKLTAAPKAVAGSTMSGAAKVAAGTVAVTGVGLGVAAAAGKLPGTEDAPGTILDFLNGATGGLFSLGSTAMYVAAGVALFILLK